MNSLNQGAIVTNAPNIPSVGNFATHNGAWRGIGGDLFNANEIAREDWLRAETASNNQLYRDLYYLEKANAFNASEAEKQRAFEKEMSNTSYSRAVADLKKLV